MDVQNTVLYYRLHYLHFTEWMKYLCDREWDRKTVGDNLRPCSAEHAYGRAKQCFIVYTIDCTVYVVKFEIRSEIGVG